jgi:threonine dehydrogenase-like Zn-dependent dehydrogenase
MTKMSRLEKLEGFGNVQMVEVDAPSPAPDEVLALVKRSLISRGSELFRRYVMEERVPPRMMGYSDAGDVVEVGAEAEGFEVGQRVSIGAPHAQYVTGTTTGESGQAFGIPAEMSYEDAAYLPLVSGAVAWMQIPPIEPGDTVVFNGQGLVGNLCSQAVRARGPGRVITVDATALRCKISKECGADEVINVSETDSVEAVMDMTDGRGADVVVECVGGFAGVKSFEAIQRMVKSDGVIHLIALYQGQALPLDTSLVADRIIIGGYFRSMTRAERLELATKAILEGRIKTGPLTTHRMPWQKTPDAYHLLYNSPEEALGVILEWD